MKVLEDNVKYLVFFIREDERQQRLKSTVPMIMPVFLEMTRYVCMINNGNMMRSKEPFGKFFLKGRIL